MATWVAHMRIADYFIKKFNYTTNDSATRFLVGNIGPDCGVPNEDWSSFTPSTDITHWKLKDGKIDANDFKHKYLNVGNEKYPFYLGYYFHLLADIEWNKLYKRKLAEPTYVEGFARDKNFIWTAKKDWYGQDRLFLQNNPKFIFYTIFSRIDDFPNIYFDFYPSNAFVRQVKYISEFYPSAEEDPNRIFPYLTKVEMDDFVSKTINVIEGEI